MTRLGLVIRGAVIALGCAAGVLAAAIAGVLAPVATSTRLPATRFAGSPLPPGLQAPAVTLHDERGRPLRLGGDGRPALIAFATAACEDTCALTLQTMRIALDDVGGDDGAVAVAVDPQRDTAARARRFLLRQRVAGRIRFALGTRAQLTRVWRAFGVQPQTAAMHHQARIVLLDGRGRQRVGYFTQDTTPEQIAHDLRLFAGGPPAAAGR